MNRGISFAARIALEHLPATKWRDRVLNLDTPQGRILGIIALARCGEEADGRPRPPMRWRHWTGIRSAPVIASDYCEPTAWWLCG